MFKSLESKKAEEFWEQYPEICWSNRNASDWVHIRAALCRPKFDCLLNIAHSFGLERLQEEWNILSNRSESLPEVERARPVVDRILRNIELGFLRATTS